MRKSFLGAVLMFGGLTLAANTASGDEFGFGVSISKGERSSFFLATSGHFKTPRSTVGLCVKHGIPDEEYPVICYLSARAKVKPEVLIKLRVQRTSWAEITLGLGLGAEIYHVPVKNLPGPPYGNAYGHYKKHKRSEWNAIVLADADIVNLVNLRFATAHYGLSPDRVIRLRASGKNFLAIHTVGKKHRTGKAHKRGKAKRHDRAKNRDRGHATRGKGGRKGRGGKGKK